MKLSEMNSVFDGFINNVYGVNECNYITKIYE